MYILHYGKKVGWWRQCYALDSVQLGNLGSSHSHGCYFDIYHLPKDCCRPCTLLHGDCVSWKHWPLTAGWCTLPHCKKFFRSGLRNRKKSSMCCLGLQISPYLNSWANKADPWRPASKLAGHKGSAVNVLVLDTTWNVQRSCRVNVLTGQQHKEGLQNVRQVVLMLLLLLLLLLSV